MARNSTKTNFLRIVAVLLGVLGAGWLFSSGWGGVFDYVGGYSFKMNFISYFFSTALFPVATLLTAVLFFIVSLRDLEPLRNAFSLVVAIVSCVALVAYIVAILDFDKTIGSYFKPSGIIDISSVLLLITYILFSLYARNGGSIKNSAWTIGLIAVIVLVVGALYGYFAKDFGVKVTVQYVLTALAHTAVFYCGLRQF